MRRLIFALALLFMPALAMAQNPSQVMIRDTASVPRPLGACGASCVDRRGIAAAQYVKGVTSAMTGTTSTVLLAAPATGLYNYVTYCVFTNTHATVQTAMSLQDGSGGTALFTGAVGPVGGHEEITFDPPLKQTTSATGLYVVNVTTGSNTFAFCEGYKAP